jgi:hypothetical protein
LLAIAGGGARSRRGVVLRDVCVWAATAGRRSRRRSRIRFARLFFIPEAFSSSVFREVGAFSVGVRGRRCFIFLVRSPQPLFCFDAELSVWDLVVGWPDPTSSSTGDGDFRSDARIRGSEMLGRRPGRCFIADGFILFLGMGVYFDSIASQWATGLLRLMVDFVCFSGGGRWRRGGRLQKEHEETRSNVVIFFFFRGLRVVWTEQLSPYPLRMYLCLCTTVCFP